MIGITHPKAVHFWKNIINNLENDGHSVKIVTWDKDITLYLLNVYGLDYEVVGKHYKNLLKKAYGMVKSDFKLLKIAKRFNPDILVSAPPYFVQVSEIIRKPHICLSDTEHANLVGLLSFPFTDVILTPSCFKRELNPKKHIKFDGYLELAYLHPHYFKPDSSILDDLELSKNDKFIVLRFVSWEASHDIGQHGLVNKKKFVKELEKYGRIFITSERKTHPDLEKYRITVPPERIHDLLYFATLYIGEGATMASEAAVLGTPSIYVNTLRLGYLDEEEKKYGLVYNFSDPKTAQEQAVEKAVTLLEDNNLKQNWRKKREKLLNEKIDVTKFLTDFIEGYPKSFYEWKFKNGISFQNR